MKRLVYLTHRWVGIVLGILVFAWFGSGIAMMYYPWPGPTEDEELAMRPALGSVDGVVGFDVALTRGRDFLAEGTGEVAVDARDLVGGRLISWDGRPMYELWSQRGGHREVALLVDGVSGAVHYPVTGDEARRVAERSLGAHRSFRGAVREVGAATGVDSLRVADHFMMAVEYRRDFPAWRVDFGDARGTSAYVSRRTGRVFGIVDTRTRITTWIGTVPHWLYFQWLHDHPTAWLWSNYLLPAIATLIALTGIVLGAWQLYPRRRRGDWTMSAYRGVSKWHHVSGIVFGILVLTWTFTGVLEMLGPGLAPPRELLARAQGVRERFEPVVREGEAVAIARRLTGDSGAVRAIDLVWSEGGAGYAVHLADHAIWIDATTGAARREVDATVARRAALHAFGAEVPVEDVAKLDAYDTYYYAGHGRGVPLPVVRVRLGDAAHTALYLDPWSAIPVGMVDARWRRWRWWRDALHTFDIPALNNRRPLWDVVTLVPMLGGTLVSITGVWLLLRRLRRDASRRSARSTGGGATVRAA